MHDDRLAAGSDDAIDELLERALLRRPEARRRRARRLAARHALAAPARSPSTTPMRSLTVTGIETAARIAATQSATSLGRSIRQAPNAPECTRSLGQPQLRLISS